MKKKSTRYGFGWVATFVVVALANAACAQDYTVRMQDQDGNISTHYVSRHAVRDVAQKGAGRGDTIYRLQEGKIIAIDYQSKTYLEMSKADIDMAATTTPASLTPQLREVIRTSGYKPSAAKLTRVDVVSQIIAGVSTEKYIATTPYSQDEVWVAPSLDVSAQYYRFASASYTTQEFGVGDIFKGLEESQVRGFVMKIVAHATVPTKTIVRFQRIAISVQKGAIPASVFTPPAGYQKAADH